MTDQELIANALRGGATEDQKRIAETGIKWLATLLRKNNDYGSSAWQPPVLAPQLGCGSAILVRMSDKVQRIATLSTKGAQVAESLEDTVSDLGSYCLLWLSRPQDQEKGKTL